MRNSVPSFRYEKLLSTVRLVIGVPVRLVGSPSWYGTATTGFDSLDGSGNLSH